jgi:hypothetical protein
MTRLIALILLLLLTGAFGLLVQAADTGAVLDLHFIAWPLRLSALALAACAFVLGAIVGGTAFSALWLPPSDAILRVLAGAVVLLILAVCAVQGNTLIARAALLLALAVAALACAYQAFRRIANGDAIRTDSASGGLGGGLAGWTLSGSASLLLLALGLAGAAVAVASLDRPAAPSGATTTSDKPAATEAPGGTTNKPAGGGTDKPATGGQPNLKI